MVSRVMGHVAGALHCPLIVLLEQDVADKPHDGIASTARSDVAPRWSASSPTRSRTSGGPGNLTGCAGLGRTGIFVICVTIAEIPDLI